MEIFIKHIKIKRNYEYVVYKNGELLYKVYAKIPNLLRLNSILIYDRNGIEICSARQENYKKLILGCIPFMFLFKFSVCPFECYRNEKNVGYIKEEEAGSPNIIGKIDDRSFEIVEQNQKYIHIFSESNQIGLIKRFISCNDEGDEYTVLFNSDLKSEIATLFCIMVNILFHDPQKQKFDPSLEICINLTRRKFNKDWKPEC